MKLRKNFKRICLFSLNLREMYNDVSMPAVHTSFSSQKKTNRKNRISESESISKRNKRTSKKDNETNEENKRKKKISRKIHVIDNTHLIYYKIEFSGEKDGKK